MKHSLAALTSLLLLSFLSACTESASDECPAGHSRCGEQCVDWSRDPLNCGACGTKCGDGYCDEGSCVVGCPDSKASCGGACVDLDSDHANCGGCGVACGEDEVCHRGSCGKECGAGWSPCQKGCVDLESDPNHCGGCGIRCQSNEVCSSGSCRAECEEGLQNCGGSCVDVMESDAHCGTCGTACQGGRRCAAGKCICPPGQTVCDGSDTCVDVMSDPGNCGGCGVDCRVGEHVSQAACERGICELSCLPGYADCDERHDNGCERNLQEDPAHCGACGNACQGGQICVAGKCTCPTGEQACPSGCANLGADPNNCGLCGKRCAELPNVTDASTCHESECVIFCQEGKWGDCNGIVDDGCEASLLTDALHCGACHNDCNQLENVVNAACSAGTCVFDCEEGWADCDGDPSNGCEGDLSVLVLCDGTCADLDSDRDHCGACNQRCTVDCREKTCIEVAGLPLSLGISHSCARLTDGTARCWGNGQDHQLGDGVGGSGHRSVRPVPVLEGAGGAPLAGIAEIALGGGIGGGFSCARMEDTTVRCWGRNHRLQAGGPAAMSSVPFPTPVERSEGVVLSGVRSIALGGDSACALLEADGSVHCWGANGGGQLGDGGSADSRYAREVVLEGDEPLRGAVQIALGDAHACALLSTGVVRCWGEGDRGQLGNKSVGTGDPSNLSRRAVPVLVAQGGAELEEVDAIHAGGDTTCALIGDKVRCWGEGGQGQIGNGSNSIRSFPTAVQVSGGGELSGVVRLAVGGRHACALRTVGDLLCWGENTYGAVGDGQLGHQTRAVPATRASDEAPIEGVVEVAAGGRHGCVRLEGGEVLCWGSHQQGQVGDGGEPGNDHRRRAVPVLW